MLASFVCSLSQSDIIKLLGGNSVGFKSLWSLEKERSLTEDKKWWRGRKEAKETWPAHHLSPNSGTGSVLSGIGTVFTNVRHTVTGGLSPDGAEGTGLGQDQHSMHSSIAATLSRYKIRDLCDCKSI